jgi:hypothetical protein
MISFPNKAAILIGSACLVLSTLVSVDAGAAPLVWDEGFWNTDSWQSQPTSANDSDGDGVVNAKDVFPNNNAEWGNFDGDVWGDFADIDDDNDGIYDYPDPDDDNDGLSDVDEAAIGTNPLNIDTDGDGASDGYEVSVGRNPLLNEAAVLIPIIFDD